MAIRMPIRPWIRRVLPALVLLSALRPAGPAGAEAEGVGRSDWLESRKALYGSHLRSSSYDLLLVPFQVLDNAVDRPARHLMTRYLDDRIRRTSNLRLPGVTIVSRALGETARTFDETMIYRLANDLKVTFLVRGYVGHDLAMKMNFEILVQERAGDAPLSPQAATTRLAWNGIPFSDESPPEEVFRVLLDGVRTRLPIPVVRKADPAPAVDPEPGAVPDSLAALAASKPATPLAGAWRLQLLGLLAPKRTGAGEPFFERSLVALEQVPPEAPGRALLRSRALFYLHRRPAAVAALGAPRTPEEKAFAAFLDGDLPGATKATAEISDPLPRLLAQIEENDLRWEFDRFLPRQETYGGLAGAFPEWKSLLMIRLQDGNRWDAPSNLLVKERLDKEFPVPGYTAESLATGRVMLGELPTEGEEIVTSVHRHVRKVLDSRGNELAAADDASVPAERDALDLYSWIGISNLAKKAYLRAYVQALPEAALRDLDLLDGIYRGQPNLTYFRALALSELAEQRQEDSRASLLRTARERAREAFSWAGGQTEAAKDGFRLLAETLSEQKDRIAAYDRDFPRRWEWNYGGAEDRKHLRKDSLSPANAARLGPGTYQGWRNNELGLLYTNTGFYILSRYYNHLASKEASSVLEGYLKANERRFDGHPDRAPFLAGIRRKAGDEAGAARIYEEAIRDTPEVWKTYHEYGDILIERGEIDNAARLFRKYPPFLARENDSLDKVAMSNYAHEAGLRFWRLGETEKAVPLFAISAGLRTGSGAGMRSSAFTALAERNYQAAALHFLEAVKRYGRGTDAGQYLSLLHAMGFGKQAWPLFDSVVGKVNDPPVWTAAFVGHRIDGSGDEEIARWYARDEIRKAAGASVGERILSEFLIDRSPLPESAGKIRTAEQEASSRGTPATGSASDLLEFYFQTRKGLWDQAHSTLKGRPNFFQETPPFQESALPYMAWGYAKSGGTSQRFLEFLEARKTVQPFGYRLAQALREGARGRHEEAVRLLKAAYWLLPESYERKLPVDPWYQLVESCEWLHADGKRPEYRELLLDWARKHQRIRPMYGWAYAVEAKHAEAPADRLRALALALYLDRRSERISGFPEEEKKMAQEWLEKNNPLRTRKEGPKGT